MADGSDFKVEASGPGDSRLPMPLPPPKAPKPKSLFARLVADEHEYASILKSLLIIETCVFIGALVIGHLEDFSSTDAFYFAVQTVTTVGLGDVTPTRDSGIVLTLLYALLAVSVVALCLNKLQTLVLADLEAVICNDDGLPDKVSRREKARQLLLDVAVILVFLLASSVSYFLFESDLDDPAEDVRSFIDAMYYTAMVFTTVGYGDIPPRSANSRMTAALFMLAGALIFAYAVSAVASAVASSHKAMMEELLLDLDAAPAAPQAPRRSVIQAARRRTAKMSKGQLQSASKASPSPSPSPSWPNAAHEQLPGDASPPLVVEQMRQSPPTVLAVAPPSPSAVLPAPPSPHTRASGHPVSPSAWQSPKTALSQPDNKHGPAAALYVDTNATAPSSPADKNEAPTPSTPAQRLKTLMMHPRSPHRRCISMVVRAVCYSPVVSIFVINLFVGAALFMHVEDNVSYLDSLYFMVVTSTTVGYGDISPQKQGTRLFFVFYLLFIVTLAGVMIGNLQNYLAEKALRKVKKVLVRGAKDVQRTKWEKFTSKRILSSVVILTVVLGVGAVCYSVLEDIRFLDAVYLVVMTLTTVGYGDISPTTKGGRWFSLAFIPLGLLLVGLALSRISQELTKERRWKTAVAVSNSGALTGVERGLLSHLSTIRRRGKKQGKVSRKVQSLASGPGAGTGAAAAAAAAAGTGVGSWRKSPASNTVTPMARRHDHGAAAPRGLKTWVSEQPSALAAPPTASHVESSLPGGV